MCEGFLHFHSKQSGKSPAFADGKNTNGVPGMMHADRPRDLAYLIVTG